MKTEKEKMLDEELYTGMDEAEEQLEPSYPSSCYLRRLDKEELM
jgi:hypothetical protein